MNISIFEFKKENYKPARASHSRTTQSRAAVATTGREECQTSDTTLAGWTQVHLCTHRHIESVHSCQPNPFV